MSIVNFKSKWVEKCVRKVLNKPEGELDDKEISKIKYVKAGGDFSGRTVLELSIEMPPSPFAAQDGGDEWAVSLYSETTIGEKYNLKDYVSTANGFNVNHFKLDEWEYAYSEQAEEEWSEFEKSIVKNNLFEDYTEEELNNIEEELQEVFLPMEDLKLLSGLVVLRLYEATVDSVKWFDAFSELKVLELAEVYAKEEEDNPEAFARLKQISFWFD